ncbi:MAG: hypothetical protein IT445_14330 [Phycisphaeraceae bacterium]|nr:hypothetical protein [Phycisphaeraceae bacterium]
MILPADLSLGDTYQLVFVSSTTTTAQSSDISYYNSFVQAAAAATGMGQITWHAIASTPAADATSNALVSTRVYDMNGDLVANDYIDF